MSAQRIANRYASAVLKTATEAGLADTLETDFAVLIRTLDASSDMRMLFRSPVIEGWRKKEIVREVFRDGALNALTLNFLDLVIDKGREPLFRDIVESYARLYDVQRGIVRVHVTSAVELTQELNARVLDAIARMTGKKVIATHTVDPSILGGISVRMGDTVLDGTLRNQLQELGREMRN